MYDNYSRGVCLVMRILIYTIFLLLAITVFSRLLGFGYNNHNDTNTTTSSSEISIYTANIE